MSVEEQKRRVIAKHSEQAEWFAAKYSRLATDPYESCFAYSRHRLRVILDRYLPRSGHGLRVLDVGCGTGHHLAELRTRGFDVAGVEGSEAMMAYARVNNPGTPIEYADVETLPFPSERFDFVVCIEVLRYLPRISSCLREISRVLKPGGVCLATAAPLLNLNGYWLVNRLASSVGLPGLVRLRQYFCTSGRLRYEFSAAGFAVPQIHGVYFGPVNWVERLAPPLAPRFLRTWERLDVFLADQPILREFSNMFLVCAVRVAARG